MAISRSNFPKLTSTKSKDNSSMKKKSVKKAPAPNAQMSPRKQMAMEGISKAKKMAKGGKVTKGKC